jgi:hypothetical protein
VLQFLCLLIHVHFDSLCSVVFVYPSLTVAAAGLHNVCMKKIIPFEYDETEEDEEDL